MILHRTLPDDLREPRALPGVAPLGAEDWLRVDEAYAGQMALRRRLLAEQHGDVVAYTEGSHAAAREVYAMTLAKLPGLGFEARDEEILCPDGVRVQVNPEDPLGTLGALVQCDICIMDKRPGMAEHHLSAAVLCFPAGWVLAEKMGRGLLRIHAPVESYDADITRRVQRLFDGVQVGRPLWRSNRHAETRAELFTPMAEAAKFGSPREPTPPDAPFVRCERQTVLRLPETRAVVFVIHTYVVRREDAGLGDGSEMALRDT